MSTLHQLNNESLSILKTIYEDQVDDRISYRNDVRRLVAHHLKYSFGEHEHFLHKYGYLKLNDRTDSFQLTSIGLEAAQGNMQRLKSLGEDINYHFQKEIEEGLHHASSKKPLPTGKRFDQHYIRFDAIGHGGIGSVWRAEHLKTGRPVAIKTLEGIDELITTGRKSTLKKHLERVTRAVARLNHPFLVPILDLSLHHTPPYYVMPLCEGGSLRDLLNQSTIAPEIGLNLFAQIAIGLAHAHDHGILHLDLKPENILLDQSGNIQLFDFGMSRTIARQVSKVGRQSYIGFGSVAYMSPELLKDPSLENASIDIYALGLILYEILVGELPGRRSPMPSEIIQGLPEPIDELFDMMTQDMVSKRPANMQEVLEIINQIAPFDRLSQQSMMMIFNKNVLKLPGVYSVQVPELEQIQDYNTKKDVSFERKSQKTIESRSQIESTVSTKQADSISTAEVQETPPTHTKSEFDDETSKGSSDEISHEHDDGSIHEDIVERHTEALAEEEISHIDDEISMITVSPQSDPVIQHHSNQSTASVSMSELSILDRETKNLSVEHLNQNVPETFEQDEVQFIEEAELLSSAQIELVDLQKNLLTPITTPSVIDESVIDDSLSDSSNQKTRSGLSPELRARFKERLQAQKHRQNVQPVSMMNQASTPIPNASSIPAEPTMPRDARATFDDFDDFADDEKTDLRDLEEIDADMLELREESFEDLDDGDPSVVNPYQQSHSYTSSSSIHQQFQKRLKKS